MDVPAALVALVHPGRRLVPQTRRDDGGDGRHRNASGPGTCSPVPGGVSGTGPPTSSGTSAIRSVGEGHETK